MGPPVGLIVIPKRNFARGPLAELLQPVLLSLWWAPAYPHLHRSPSNTSRWVWSSLLWSHCCFPQGLGASQSLFVSCPHPQRVESLFPSVLWKSCNQIPLAHKVRFPRNSQSLSQIASLGSLKWGSEPSQVRKTFFGIIVLQFVVHLPCGYGIWFYPVCASPTILWQLLLCFCTWSIFFLWVPVSSCLWLFNNYLRFLCSRRRRWVCVLVFHHPEPESSIICCLKEVHIKFNSIGRLKVEEWKMYTIK